MKFSILHSWLNICLLAFSYETIKVRRHPMSTDPAVKFPIERVPFSYIPPIDPSSFPFVSLAVNEKDNGIEKLVNFQSVQYYGDIWVGTPGQFMTTIYDTGSSIAILMSSKCDYTCNTSKQLFYGSASSTYKKYNNQVTLTYGSGPVSGFVASDSFNFTMDIKITNVIFVEVTHDETGIDDIADGLIGLGRAGLAGGLKTPFQLMIDQKQVSQPIFSFWLGNETEGGELVLGGINEDRYIGSIDWIPVTDENTVKNGYWSTGYRGATVNTKLISTNMTVSAIFDTGTSALLLPLNVCNELIKANQKYLIPYDIQGAKYYFLRVADVKFLVPLTFHIGTNRTYSLTGANYMKSLDEYYLMLNVFAIAEGDVIILGEPFLRKYYSAYDQGQNRIGLALSKSSSVSSGSSSKTTSTTRFGMSKSSSFNSVNLQERTTTSMEQTGKATTVGSGGEMRGRKAIVLVHFLMAFSLFLTV